MPFGDNQSRGTFERQSNFNAFTGIEKCNGKLYWFFLINTPKSSVYLYSENTVNYF